MTFVGTYFAWKYSWNLSSVIDLEYLYFTIRIIVNCVTMDTSHHIIPM